MDFTHFDRDGKAWMVDVGGKAETEREAVAAGRITMSRECFDRVSAGNVEKGDVLGAARIAGIMGAKKTPDIIPLCHIVNLTKLSVDFELLPDECAVRAICTAKATGRTGVEMEALTGVSCALLTIYDMCKAIDKEMEIGGIMLLKKRGARAGTLKGCHRDEHEGNGPGRLREPGEGYGEEACRKDRYGQGLWHRGRRPRGQLAPAGQPAVL